MNPAILQQALARIETLGAISDTPGALTRTFLSPASRKAAEVVMKWMEELGMTTAHDAGGTIRGILPGTDPTRQPLLLGSHLDTVIDAGKYDGALGIIAALSALECLREDGIQLAYPVHLFGFSDEEGVRFQSTYLGSRGILADDGGETIIHRDAEGRTLDEVLANEGWHEDALEFCYDSSSSSGYVELHIEQGRVLEETKEPACVVSAICAQARLRITLTGMADHAGTTPMDLRSDALTGAAECILTVEQIARKSPPLVGTVGMIRVSPGASNAIPQLAEFTLDVRHPDDSALGNALLELHREFLEIASRRQLDLQWLEVQKNGAITCNPDLTGQLAASLTRITGSKLSLPSGAGHDGVVLSIAMPIAMLFIRCRAGLSHHPDEYAEPGDIAIGINVLADFLKHRTLP